MHGWFHYPLSITHAYPHRLFEPLSLPSILRNRWPIAYLDRSANYVHFYYILLCTTFYRDLRKLGETNIRKSVEGRYARGSASATGGPNRVPQTRS